MLRNLPPPMCEDVRGNQCCYFLALLEQICCNHKHLQQLLYRQLTPLLLHLLIRLQQQLKLQAKMLLVVDHLHHELAV